MLDIETISAVAFIAVVIFLAILDRKNIEFKYGMIMRRTKKGKNWLYDTARKHYKLIYRLTTIGVIVCLITSVLTFGVLAMSLYTMVANPQMAIEQGPSSRLILPQIGEVKYPGFVLGVPFWYWLIGIFVVVSVHEPFHAFAARLKNIAIKSIGVAVLFIFPMAFVEPNENQIKRLKMIPKMRIYSAGSFANLMAALGAVFVVFVLGNVAVNIFVPVGVKFNETLTNTPAQTAGLQGIITAVNGEPVEDLSEFVKIMDGVKPSENIEIETSYGVYNLTAIENPQNSSKAFIGVGGLENEYAFGGTLSDFGKPSEVLISSYSWVQNLFVWLFIINLGVGSLNLLPVRFLDGGYLYEAIFQKYFSKTTADRIITALSLASIFLIVMSLFGTDIIRLLITH